MKIAINAVIAASMLALSGAAEARVPTPECRTPASDLSWRGQPLDYERANSAPGAFTVASTGTVYVPVTLPNGRVAVYAIGRDGCMRKTGLQSTHR